MILVCIYIYIYMHIYTYDRVAYACGLVYDICMYIIDVSRFFKTEYDTCTILHAACASSEAGVDHEEAGPTARTDHCGARSLRNDEDITFLFLPAFCNVFC